MESYVVPQWLMLPHSTCKFSQLYTLQFLKNICDFLTHTTTVVSIQVLTGLYCNSLAEGLLNLYPSSQILTVTSVKLIWFLKLYFPYTLILFSNNIFYFSDDYFTFTPIEQMFYHDMKAMWNLVLLNFIILELHTYEAYHTYFHSWKSTIKYLWDSYTMLHTVMSSQGNRNKNEFVSINSEVII